MTNYTDGQIEELLAKLRSMAVEVHQHIGADSEHQRVSRLLVSSSLALSDLAERQAAKAGVVTEPVDREVFEQWASDRSWPLIRINEGVQGAARYEDLFVSCAWLAWQARAALASVWPTAGGDSHAKDTEIYRLRAALEDYECPFCSS